MDGFGPQAWASLAARAALPLKRRPEPQTMQCVSRFHPHVARRCRVEHRWFSVQRIGFP